MEQKDILIITNFGHNFSVKNNGRFMYLAEKLAVYQKVEIVTSDFYHVEKRHRKKREGNCPFQITFLHEPGYKKNVCFKRFFSHYIWGKNVEKYLRKRNMPDVVYCAVPSLVGAYKAARFCKRNNIKFIIDIQDLWPEAFQMVFHIPVLRELIFAPFRLVANSIYKSADEICAVSQTYLERALSVNKKCPKGHAVFLGTNLETFDQNMKENAIIKKDKNEVWLVYCGTLGSSYDLISVFNALDIVKKERKKTPKFIIMGDGPKRKEFEDYAKKKKIDVQFMGRIPYEKMCGVLAACDIAVNSITHGAAQSIINKHADYVAGSLPVLNTQECREYRDLVKSYEMGFNCKNSDSRDLAEKLYLLIQDVELREKMGRNARKCAEEKFDRKQIYIELIEVIEGLQKD
jgi:glycosyltransferase involved in cell wall biosynthesis